MDFGVDENGVMKYRDRVCMSDLLEHKKRILEEGHMSGLSIHPGATKMYQDLKKMFWWSVIKKDVDEFAYFCLTFHNSKIKHQKLSGLVQPLSITEWKWDNISMDFVVSLSKTTKGSDSI